MTAFNDTFGIIGLSSENVGIDRRIYTGLTSTNPQLNVSYNGGRVDVYLNGVKLMGNHSGQSNYDYTYQSTGSGSAITLSTGVALVATDTIECVGYVSNSSNTVTTYTPSVSAGNNTFTSISHTSSDLLNVFLNGVLLDPSDYTADASADTVAITSLASGDVVHIQVIGALDHSDFVPAGGGTFSGNVDIANAELEVSNTGTTGNIPTIRLKSTEVNVGNGDVLGQIDFKSADSGRSGDPIASIKAVSSEADGSHTDLTFSTGENADVASERMRIDSSGNLKFNSGFGSVATAYGCRAWVNFRGTTQSGTATASGLVSGQYTATVTSATQFTVVYSSTTYTINTTGNHDIAGGVVGQSEGVDLTVSGTSVTIDTQIRGSGNVSSITDNGTGDYTINFTNAMSDANYVVHGTMGESSSGANAIIPTIGNSHALSTSSVRVGFFVYELARDPGHGFISIFR